ncbi:MAG: hypothetical protein F9K23_18405 [Bacteroidetes bacterium]|nr:MAG: hypothetical protein F9K23_18405 [Bacteroidota bacterium]
MKIYDDTTKTLKPFTPPMQPPQSIIGISTGTKHLGIAIEKNGELIEWKTCRFRGTWSPQKLHTIIRYIEKHLTEYSIHAIALKIPKANTQSSGLMELKEAIVQLAKDSNTPVYTYTIRDLRSRYSVKGVSYRLALMYALCDAKPELKREFNREVKYKSGYYFKIFEAAACIELCYRMWDL